MSALAAGDVTQILGELKQGQPDAEGRLVPLVYRELRRIAAAQLRRENPDHTLQPTALVHEAWFRLVRVSEVDWQSRSHFFAVCATIMRRILVDHARAQQAAKRGERAQTIEFDEGLLAAPERSPEILSLHEALDRLALLDERQAKIVEMRFFAGLTEEEIALVLGISARTVKRDWRLARAWLYQELAA